MATRAKYSIKMCLASTSNRCSQVWRVLTKLFGECRRVCPVDATVFGKCQRVWRVHEQTYSWHCQVWQMSQVPILAKVYTSAHNKECSFFAQKTYVICIKRSSLHLPNLRNTCQTCFLWVPYFCHTRQTQLARVTTSTRNAQQMRPSTKSTQNSRKSSHSFTIIQN